MALRCHNAFANRYASLDLSLCVSGAVLTYDSRHPTRTQYPGDVSTCRCYVDLGTSRRLAGCSELESRLGLVWHSLPAPRV